MSKKLFAVMTVLALGALGFVAASMQPSAPAASNAATTSKPVVETKVIRRTVHVTRRAQAAGSSAAAAGAGASASSAPASQPVAAPRASDDDRGGEIESEQGDQTRHGDDDGFEDEVEHEDEHENEVEHEDEHEGDDD